MIVHFVGAGPGDPELLTLKAARLLSACRICVYAGSLVSPGVLALIPEAAERHDSAKMSHDEVVAVYKNAQERGIDVVRLHSGDPSIYGATREQMNALDTLGIPFDVCPGVSSFQAAAAALRTELTAPEISQTIILTRTAGRTPLPEEQELDRIARTHATLCIFLSIEKIREAAETLAAHYGADCPAAVVHRASWPEEKVIRGTLADIATRTEPEEIHSTALIVVGRALGRDIPASKLYDAAFSHGFREGKDTVNADTIALITLSAEGAKLLAPLLAALPGVRLYIHESVPDEPARENPKAPAAQRFTRIADLTAALFPVCRGLVYAAPAGVVVRAIAPLIRSKYDDPAVVVIDAGGRWAVSLLAGHEGGANALAIRVANILGAEPVVTTTTEALKSVIVGIGCRRGTPAERIVAAVNSALAEAGVALAEVRLLASADLKADEAGLLAAAEALGVPVRFIPGAEIRASLRDFSHSDLVKERVNLPAVAEPAALLAGSRTRFICRRKTYDGITIALAREGFPWAESAPEVP